MAGPSSGHAACDTSIWQDRLVATLLVTLLYGRPRLVATLLVTLLYGMPVEWPVTLLHGRARLVATRLVDTSVWHARLVACDTSIWQARLVATLLVTLLYGRPV